MSNFFTSIKDPKDFRRELLLSSKEVIEILKDNQALAEIRNEKKAKIGDLKKHFDELNSMLDKLDNFIPDDSIKKLKEIMPEAPKVEIKEKPKPRKKGKRKSKKKPITPEQKEEEKEIDRLEKQLAQVEKKLDSI